MVINLITGLFLFSSLAFGGINTQIKSEAKQEEAPQADAAIVFIDGQASCLTFNENASADWQDTVQDESGLGLCSQQQNSQEVQGFVQSFQSDTIAEDSQYAFLPSVIAGVGGCVIGGILFAYYHDKDFSATPSTGAIVAGTVVTAVTAVAAVSYTPSATLAALATSIPQLFFYLAKIVPPFGAGALLCSEGLFAIFIQEEKSPQGWVPAKVRDNDE